ncbi:MAG: SDR family NAD(P)-dependent oxidoreductase [Prevotellaceae bacterium]|jgi:NAD(P)-dependent dehydrogenase (short-subunit alcohol dehydrogenase family)|nr:SDR family NAD(P)-dependent oxidoreductase [Prevotellaceae bacterium]
MQKLIVLTGASDGIGAAAARILSQHGHRLVLVGRTPQKIKHIAEQTKAERYFAVDYENLDEVSDLANELLKQYSHIDVLANNAGGIFNGPIKTKNGFEKSFQINHLAPFLLTYKLLNVLIKSKATVVNTSSIAAKLFGHIDIDDLNSWKGAEPEQNPESKPSKWSGFKANRVYGNGKLANILHVKSLHHRYHAEGLSAVAFHPGVIASNFAGDTNSLLNRVYHSFLKIFLASPEKGGERLAYFAEGIDGNDWTSGNYYQNKKKTGTTNPQASDRNLADRLWSQSLAMLEKFK